MVATREDGVDGNCTSMANVGMNPKPPPARAVNHPQNGAPIGKQSCIKNSRGSIDWNHAKIRRKSSFFAYRFQQKVSLPYGMLKAQKDKPPWGGYIDVQKETRWEVFLWASCRINGA